MLFIFFAAVPLLYPAIPPLVDLPGHMGRYRVQLDLAHSPELGRHYTFAWALIGNLGVDLLVIPVAKIFGLELGTKLIVACIPPLTVAGFLAVAREVHGRIPATSIFALPLAYNHAFNFGFVNFALGMSLAFLAFALWLRLGRQGRWKLRAALFAPIGLVLFIVHAFGWGALGLLAFSSELVRTWRGKEAWPSSVAAAIGKCLVLALPVLPLLLWRAEGVGTFQYWFDIPMKLGWLASILRDQSWMHLVRTLSFGLEAQDQQRQFAALDRIRVGARVLTLAGHPCEDGWALRRNGHYAGLVIVRRYGFSNDQWIAPGLNLLDVRNAGIAPFDRDSSQAVSPVECENEDFWSVDRSLRTMPRGWFDYLWLIDAKPKDPRLLGNFEMVWQSGDSALYKLR